MKVAVEHIFTGSTESLTGTYSSEKTMISSLISQVNGVGLENKYISTRPSAMVNIPEVSGSSGNQHIPHAIKWSNNIYWIFTATNAATAATRTISLFEFNSNVSTLTHKGFITLSGTVVAGNKIIRSLRGLIYKHTTGTVSTSGTSTTINGSGTGFTSERIASGARIGFGTTDPTQVSTWYEITSITNDTTLIISAPVNLSAGTSYVIEEIRIAVAVTNATLINGGIHLIKGLNYGTFTIGGTTISEATTVDNIRASYLLKDAAVAGAASATVTYSTTNILSCTGHGLVTGDVVVFTTTGTLPTGLAVNTLYYVISTNLGANQFSLSAAYNSTILSISAAGSGTHTVHAASNVISATLAFDDQVSSTDHPIYLVNATSAAAAASISRYNLRASLTVGALTGGPASGVSSSAYVLKTSSVAITGTISQNNCGRVFTVSHGSASGIKSLWFVTTTRVFRCPVSSIVSNGSGWLVDFMIEVPPGSSTNFSVLNTMSQVDYSSTIDRLFITTTSGRFGVYVSPYSTSGDQFDKYVGVNLSRLKLTTTPSGSSDGLFPQATLTIWTEDGWFFAIPSSTTAGLNWFYAFPFGADASYESISNQYLITPKLATPNATKLYRSYVNHQEYSGTGNLGFPVESYRLWYRTSGIDDNSGAWTEIPTWSDLTSVIPGTHIQFKIAFNILGEICIPTKIYSISCVYEDGSQDFHYLPSVSKSSVASKIFAWQQVVLWGTNIPDLRIKLFDASTNLEIFNDTVNGSSFGTWEYSLNGTSWFSWDNTQDAIGNYIRYTATGFGYSGVTVRAILSQV